MAVLPIKPADARRARPDTAAVEPALLRERAAAIGQRGLMSFPSDDADDVQRIATIAALLAFVDGPLRLRLPRCDLTIEAPPGTPPQLVYYLALGDYEQHDLDLARDYVKRGDRVLEIGGGIGVTGCALARASGHEVVVVEANPALWRAIERNFMLNGCQLRLIRAAAAPASDAGGAVAFSVRENYWWSSLGIAPDGHRIDVPAITLDALLRQFQPTVLVVDVEGAETTLFDAPLADSVRTVLIEIHSPQIGSVATARVASGFFANGFTLADIRGWTWVFTR